MTDHFAAFSFVDRITEFEPARRARARVRGAGRDSTAFPSCLVAEAVGQLAAWVAMEKIAFRGRPVAALANETRFHGEVRPGEHAGTRRRDRALRRRGRGLRRHGRASTASSSIELHDCLGPMLPVAEFDRPGGAGRAPRAAARRRAPRRGVSRRRAPRTVERHRRRARLRPGCRCPPTAPFFADHFPRRAGVPGDAAARRADRPLRCSVAPPGHVPARMTHVKMRSFIEPGDAAAHRGHAPRRPTPSRLALERARRRPGPSPPRASRPDRSACMSSAKTPAPRRDHRPRPRDAGRQRCRDHLGRAARRPQRRRADQPVRRERLLRPASPPRSRASTTRRSTGGCASTRRARTASPSSPPSRPCATPASAPTPDRHALGLRGRRRHDDLGVPRTLPRCMRIRRRAANSTPRGCSTTLRRNDPMMFCRSNANNGVALLTRRHGIRGYATSVHTACASGGQALGTALKLIRRGAVDRVLAGGFDSMISPVGLAGFCLLSAVSADNDDARAREPPVRRHAQRLPARRRRGLPRPRGMGVGPRARRAHLRRARRRRQLAVELPHHRLATRRRRPDPGHARRARRRRRDAGRHRLPQRPRHLDRHERPQRERGDARRVRRRGRAPVRELDQEQHGPPDRRRGRGRDRASARSRSSAARCRSTPTTACPTPTAS